MFKVGEGQATMETAGARNDLRSTLSNEEGNKQAMINKLWADKLIS